MFISRPFTSPMQATTVQVQADLSAMKGVTPLGVYACAWKCMPIHAALALFQFCCDLVFSVHDISRPCTISTNSSIHLAFDNAVTDFCFVGTGGQVAVCSGSTRLSIWQTAETEPSEVAAVARAHEGRLDAVHLVKSAGGQSVLLTAGGGPTNDQLRLWRLQVPVDTSATAASALQAVGSFDLSLNKEQQQRPTTVEVDVATRRVYLMNHKYPKMLFAVSLTIDNMVMVMRLCGLSSALACHPILPPPHVPSPPSLPRRTLTSTS